MMRVSRGDEGFTLAELMVVVLIIGILVAMAMPVVDRVAESVRLGSCQANQRTIEGAVQQYLAADPANVWTAEVVAVGGKLVPVYLKRAPVCPASGLGYAVNADGVVENDQATLGGAAWKVDGGTNHAHF